MSGDGKQRKFGQALHDPSAETPEVVFLMRCASCGRVERDTRRWICRHCGEKLLRQVGEVRKITNPKPYKPAWRIKWEAKKALEEQERLERQKIKRMMKYRQRDWIEE